MTNLQSESIIHQYEMYIKVIKPLLSEIEATYERFPTPIYNELRSFIDHISRCYREGVTEIEIDRQIGKAQGHINRIILDCYKFLVVYYSDSVKEFEKQTKRIDMTSIGSGKFYINYRKLKRKAIAQTKFAKRTEYTSDKESVKYNEFEKAYNFYIKLDKLISANMTDVNWARAKFYSSKFFAFISWIVALTLGALIKDNYMVFFDFILNQFR